MAEQLNLSQEEGWTYRSQEERMLDASLIKFVYRGLEISYSNEKESRAKSIEQLRVWFPESDIF